ncbi:MAG: S8 family serine peptidase [Pirellulales bacterium]
MDPRLMLSVFDRAALLNATGPVAPAAVAPTLDQLYRISDDLIDLYATEVAGLKTPASGGLAPYSAPLTRGADGKVGIDVSAVDVALLEPLLSDLGFVSSAVLPDHHLIEGYLPLAELLNASTLTAQGLLGLAGIAQPQTSTGSTLDEADYTLQAARTRATNPPGVDGTGVTIGVISDSYNNKGGAAAGIASGDLPASLVFLRDNVPANGTDEGRGMMELVHDLAPGSPKAFATANGGEATFAQNIRDLAKSTGSGGAGAKVIVDDVFYFAEPMFQDGIVAQAIDDVVTNNGVSYFSSAGNLEDQAYENTSPTFTTTTIAGISASPAKYLQFSAGVFTQNVTLSSQTFLAGLQWSDPFYTVGGVASNLDFFVLSGGSVIASSTANNIASNVPNEILGVSGTGTAQLVVRLTAGADPTRLKWVNFGANGSGPVTIQFDTTSPTITPHSASANAMSVAAAPMYDQRTVEGFSSKGPSTILFGPSGAAIPAAVRAKPDLMANDGTSTTFFGSTISGLPHPLFFGTSAAAPNAAAVAALVRQANPGFTPAQVYSRLTSTADPNVVGGVNFVGAGLVDAYRAVIGQPQAAALPVSDGFESGVLAQRWDVWNGTGGRTAVSTANSPATGADHLVLDNVLPSGFAVPGLSEAILHINLAGQTAVTLEFDAKLFGSESVEPMPGSFAGHNNSDGVALSVDGTNWVLLSALSGLTSAYKSWSVDLSAAAAAAALTLTADTQIKFQRYGGATGQAPASGLALDNVSIAATVVPISGVTTIQAEEFVRRQAAVGHRWSIVNAETPGVGSFSGATGPSNDFIQALTLAGQDSPTTNVTPATPYVEYDIDAPQAGVYELLVRAAGVSSASDSLWVAVSGGALLDAQGNTTSGSALLIPTNHSAGFELLNAGRWTLSAGVHTIRVSMRESGTGLDALQIVPPPTLGPGVPISGVTEIQAEDFVRRQTGTGHQWWIVNQEVPGVGAFTGATGPSADYLQALTSAGQDSTAVNLSPSGPYVEYDIQVPLAGDYDLVLRAAGLSGTSDSLWVEVTTGALSNSQGNATSGNALLIQTGSSSSLQPLNAGRWTLTAGVQTIRVSMRESGAALDALQIVPPSSPGAGVPINGTTDIQAEDFVRRQSGAGHQWSIVDQESAGVGAFSGATGPAGDYLQALTQAGQDSVTTNLTPAAPYLEYEIQIMQAGLYDLKLRVAGISSASDSLWVELPSGSLSDAQGNTAAGGALKIETNSSGVFTLKNAGRWNLAVGVYTIRISMRESGTALDALQIVPV